VRQVERRPGDVLRVQNPGISKTYLRGVYARVGLAMACAGHTPADDKHSSFRQTSVAHPAEGFLRCHPEVSGMGDEHRPRTRCESNRCYKLEGAALAARSSCSSTMA
jgi:hypothetical protein